MPTYSHSKLATFEDCPLKYRYKYIDRVQVPEVESIEAFLGSRVHETFEKLYGDLLNGRQNTLEQILAIYEENWQRNWGPEVTIVDTRYTADDYRRVGEDALRKYYNRFYPFNQTQTLGLEERLTFPLDQDGRYRIVGFIDRIARRADGTLEIHDYKTSRSLPSQQQMDQDRQLALYHIGLRHEWRNVESVELMWHYVRFDTTLVSRRDDAQLRDLAAQTMALIDRIEAEQAFEPVRSRLCDWCEYRSICPLWKHVAAVEKLPAREWKKDAGVQLAGEYYQLQQEKKRVESQLEAVREQVLDFARLRQVRTIKGQGVLLNIKFSKRTSFPTKDDPQRPALEKLINESGRWNEVSELSAARLAEALKNPNWPESLRSRLQTLASTKEIASIYVRRPGDADLDEE